MSSKKRTRTTPAHLRQKYLSQLSQVSQVSDSLLRLKSSPQKYLSQLSQVSHTIPPHALRYSFVNTNSRCPSTSAAASLPLAIRCIITMISTPASFNARSRLSSPLISTSMCSPIVLTVLGLAEIFITGIIGLPTTLPCPVVKKWKTDPAAAHSVTASAAAEEVSMK